MTQYRQKRLDILLDYFSTRLNNKLTDFENDPATGLTPGDLTRISAFQLYDDFTGEVPLMYLKYRSDEYTREEMSRDYIANVVEIRFKHITNDVPGMTQDLLYYVDAVVDIINESTGQTLGNNFQFVRKVRTDFPNFYGEDTGEWYGIIKIEIEIHDVEY